MAKRQTAKLIDITGRPLSSKAPAKSQDKAPGPAMPECYLEPVRDKDALPIPLLWRVIVQPVTIPEKIGNITIPDVIKDRMEYLRSFGRVVAIGPLAWCDDTKFGADVAAKARAGEYPVKIGTWVLFDQYKGQIVEINGQKFKRLNDDDIDAIVPKPEAVQLKF